MTLIHLKQAGKYYDIRNPDAIVNIDNIERFSPVEISDKSAHSEITFTSGFQIFVIQTSDQILQLINQATT